LPGPDDSDWLVSIGAVLQRAVADIHRDFSSIPAAIDAASGVEERNATRKHLYVFPAFSLR